MARWRCCEVLAMMELIEQLCEAAVIEARTVPKMLLRDGEIQWRAVGGVMVSLTNGLAPWISSLYRDDIVMERA